MVGRRDPCGSCRFQKSLVVSVFYGTNRSRRNSSRENFYGAGMKVRPFSNKLICAADGVKSLDKFKILEEEDQVKSGGGVEFLPKHHRLVCFNFPIL